MTTPASLRFPALWAPDAPGLRPLVKSWAHDVLLVERAHRWASWRLAIPAATESLVVETGQQGTSGRKDGRVEWDEYLRLVYTKWSSATATPLVERELTSRLREAGSLAEVAREMWPAWWDSGVLPGDLPPLDREKMGLIARFIDRHRHKPAPGQVFRPLVPPPDLLRVQAPLALMARTVNASWEDPVARVWLGAWNPERAEEEPLHRHGAVDLSRARYVLATTGWPAATREEAGIHLWDLWSRSRFPMGTDEGSEDRMPPIAESDPWLVLLAEESPARARAAMLDFLGRDAATAPRSGWLTPRLSVELAGLLPGPEGEQLARQWVRSPIQAWREAGLLLLTQVRHATRTTASRTREPQAHDGLADGPMRHASTPASPPPPTAGKSMGV